MSRYQPLSNAVCPHLSQYAYAVSPKPLCNSSYWNWPAQESQVPVSIFATAIAPNDEVERRGCARTTNGGTLSQSSTPSFAHRRCCPRDRSSRLLGPTATLSTYKRLRFPECSWIRISNSLPSIFIVKRKVTEAAAHEVFDGTPLRPVRKGRCRKIS